MKRSILFSVFLLLINVCSSAQSFTQLGTDPSGDAQNGPKGINPDIKTVSYALDIAKDSVWFKVETNNAITINDDFGMIFGLDTNMLPTDGTGWYGNNTSMKFDQALFVMMNMIMPGFYYAEVGKMNVTKPIFVSVKRPDNFTFIIGAQLSLLDKDGKFNLIVAGSSFSASSNPTVYDEAPDAGKGYFSVPPGASCNAPASINTTNLKDTSVTINWGAIAGASGYEYVVDKSSASPSSGTPVSGVSANINKLTASTTYYAHVRTKCNSSYSNSWTTQSFKTAATTSITGVNIFSELSIYPNPASGAVNIVGRLNTKSTVEIEMLNAIGQIVYADKLEPVSNNVMKHIDVNLPAGVYTLLFYCAEGKQVSRLVINN